MKKILSLIVLWAFLASCGEEVVTVDEKIPYEIQVKVGSSYGWSSYIEKTGRVTSSQDIALSAQAAGRVENISVKVGDTVSAGQSLASLTDSLGSYGIALAQASNGVERAKISYDSTALQLDKQIFDLERAIADLERNKTLAQNTAEQNLLQAEDSLTNSSLWDSSSTAQLQIQQLENNIAKAKLDYDNQVIANEQTLSSYAVNAKKEVESMVIIMDDVIEFTDTLLGVTELNKRANDDYEDYLGRKDSSTKQRAKTELRDLITYRESESLQTLRDTLGDTVDLADLSEIQKTYQNMQTLLEDMQTTINNSLESVWVLSSVDIQTFLTQNNGLQSTVLGGYTGFLAYKNQTDTFLKTYENTQNSLAKSIALQEADLEIQKKRLQSGQLSAEIAYEQTKLQTDESVDAIDSQLISTRKSLETAQKNKEVTLRSLTNAIEQAQIAYRQAANEYAKLSITSPINGTVTEISIDQWQELSPGSPIMTIISDKTPEVQVGLSQKEKELVTPGMEVLVKYADQEIKGTVYAVSDVADSLLNYQTTIVFKSGTTLIWDVVEVDIPVATGKMLLPINLVDSQGGDIGRIQTFSGAQIETVRVRLGEIYGENIEIISCAQECKNLQIITNDISSYNPNKFVLTPQN